jgi:hypothetical protein
MRRKLSALEHAGLQGIVKIPGLLMSISKGFRPIGGGGTPFKLYS